MSEQYSEKTLGLAFGELLVFVQAVLVGSSVPHNTSLRCSKTNLGERVRDDGGFVRILLGSMMRSCRTHFVGLGVFAVSADALLVGF